MTQPETHAGALHVCPWWLIRVFDNPLRRIMQDPYKILSDVVKPGDACLDLGCGIGYFTIPMAKLAGPAGSVTAVDLQAQMLEGVLKRARKAHLEAQVNVRQVDSSGLDFAGVFDFALAFWMLHEVPDQRLMLVQIRQSLKSGGRFLLVEPKGHVSEAAFADAVRIAQELGFSVRSEGRVSLSRMALFSNDVATAA